MATAETLKKFDCVLFFTTGNPLNDDEVKDLVAWVKAGGAVAGTHCGSDTLYPAKDRPWNEAWTARHDLYSLRTMPDWRIDRGKPSSSRGGWHRAGGNRGTFL